MTALSQPPAETSPAPNGSASNSSASNALASNSSASGSPASGSSAAAGPGARADRAVIRDSLGVGVAVGVSGVAFGVAGTAAHLTVWQTCALSLLVFTGASQFALIGALAAGAAPLAAVVGALFLGVRNAFYGLRLAERLELPRWARPLAAQTVIDETAAVSLVQPDRRSTRLGFAVTGISLYLFWNVTTLAGALGANALGDPSRYGLDVAGPAVFLALLAPRLREGGAERATALVGAVLALAAVPLVPAGVPVLIALAAVPAVLLLGSRRREPKPADPTRRTRPTDSPTDSTEQEDGR